MFVSVCTILGFSNKLVVYEKNHILWKYKTPTDKISPEKHPVYVFKRFKGELWFYIQNNNCCSTFNNNIWVLSVDITLNCFFFTFCISSRKNTYKLCKNTPKLKEYFHVNNVLVRKFDAVSALNKSHQYSSAKNNSCR